MSESTTKAPTPATKPLTAPEETFWQRYSAHHEAPLSGMTSLAIHLLAIPLLLLLGWLIIKLGLGEDSKPLPVAPVQMSGGGGSPHASDRDASDAGVVKDVEIGPSQDKERIPL